MTGLTDQILSVAAMRAAENTLIAGGTSVNTLMQRAGRGAAEYVWRLAAGGRVTVLCGAGNNGGDGYVIAEVLRERGLAVAVVAPALPGTEAARTARALYRGEVRGTAGNASGEVWVDCLLGSGLTRALGTNHAALLAGLAARHRLGIAVDVPSGVEADSGALLGDALPAYDLSIALGAWKYAHFLIPAAARMGALRLVDIGIGKGEGAARVLRCPAISAPAADAHKYKRGLLGVIGGVMPGAALLAATAAQGAGAGYVRLLAESPLAAPPSLVVETGDLAEALADPRYAALLIGPGLGAAAKARLEAAIATGRPLVIDADALRLLTPAILDATSAPKIATPHAGELAALEAAFGLPANGAKPTRALALAAASGMVVVAKGPDTVVAAPDGRHLCAPRASSWLSTAGTGDVLAGVIASRLACGRDAFTAAAEGVWLHGEAARLAGPAFDAGTLAAMIPRALEACL